MNSSPGSSHKDVTTLELRDYLADLQAERRLALVSGLAGIESYMTDLDQELETCRELFTVSVVTEIATLRGELFGRQLG
jgi:hypothetical protein